MLQATNLKCESLVNPIGLDEARPRFSWQITSTESAVQSSYRIQVFQEMDDRPLWDSGRVSSRSSVLAPYKGPALRPRTRYYWQVRVWDQKGRDSGYSDRACWETGLMKASGFQGDWISNPDKGNIGEMQPCPMLRRSFMLDRGVVRARVYVSALGVYSLALNGRAVSEDVLAPGWTSYATTVQYQTYDVTGLLCKGENVLSAVLGDGWYRGYLVGSKPEQRNHFGQRLALMAQLHISLDDGTERVIRTDENWKAWENGPIRYADFYQGICYDARLELPGWKMPGYDDSAWPAAALLKQPKTVLCAQADQPVRRRMTLSPVRVITTPRGETVLDMGQNMVGWLRFRVQGEAGTTVTVRHGEVLDADGNFYHANYRSAKSEIVYTLKGGGQEAFEPIHTFFGFRYAKLENWPCEVRAEDFEGVVVCSNMPVTAGFECSDERVNQLFSNIMWGQRGNFVDVPTDCPQRDERLGWTGDCQAFARTACINMDCHSVLAGWLADLAASQRADGAVPYIVPDVLGGDCFGSAAWGDAATVVPWTLYQCYGDERILEKQYLSMRRWLDFIDSQSDGYLWDGGTHFGDWLGLDAHEGSYEGATDKTLIATAFYAHSTRLTMQAAEVLGYEKDKLELSQLLKRIIRAYRREFITPNGRLAVRTQTAYALTLYFDLAEEMDRPRMVGELIGLIRENGGHLSTGVVGTPYLCLALTEAGAHDIAGQLLMKSDYPSWLYPITKGATTMWEHWDGIKPDGSFWSTDMNSYNHYAYGAIGEWMMRALAGIDMVKPGYAELLLHPRPIEELSFVSAWQDTPYGMVRCDWRIDGNLHAVGCTVPAGTTAVLVLEHADLYQVTESERMLSEAPGVVRAWQSEDDVMIELGSGKYSFSWRVQET